MKKIFFTITLVFLSLNLFAQNEKQACQILDKTINNIKSSGGIELTFSGTTSGKLLLNKDKFYFNSEDTQSWFDGKTQWSYVDGSNEVNISNPTPEEISSVNPYYLLLSYKNGYTQKYKGIINLLGKQVYEIVLTPKKRSSISSIYLFISKSYQPVSVRFVLNNKKIEKFDVTSYKTKLRLNDSIFKFNKNRYPKAEIIDLR